MAVHDQLPTLLVAVSVTGAFGTEVQAQDNPLSTELRQSWTRTWGNIAAAAEKMPEEHYGFKPAPAR